MKIELLKSEFHELIDRINDSAILTQFYDAISQSVNNEGTLWNSLTSDQQQQVLEAYEKSEDESNLISLAAIRSKFN